MPNLSNLGTKETWENVAGPVVTVSVFASSDCQGDKSDGGDIPTSRRRRGVSILDGGSPPSADAGRARRVSDDDGDTPSSMDTFRASETTGVTGLRGRKCNSRSTGGRRCV